MKTEVQSKLSLVSIPTKNEKVKKVLNEWLEMEDVEEIFILGKVKGRQFRWEFSKMDSLLFWMGFFTYMANKLSDWQNEG